jgi:hypothetical protein
MIKFCIVYVFISPIEVLFAFDSKSILVRVWAMQNKVVDQKIETFDEHGKHRVLTDNKVC